MIEKAKRNFKKAKNRLNANRRYVAPAALIVGFVLDNLTLNRIDQVFDQVILLVHLVLVGGSIAFLYRWYRLGDKSRISDKWANRMYTLMAFSAGGIYSGLVIFYGRSGSLIQSWPLLLVLVVFLFGSEFAKKYLKAMSVQILMFLVALYLYLVILVPILSNELGIKWFVFSTVVWGVLAASYFYVLSKFGKSSFGGLIKRYAKLVTGILLVVVFGYFFKVMPPVPLSLKFDAVYHSVVRTSSGYLAEYEPNPWWQFWDKRDNTLEHQKGEPVYVFTSVFAPNKFKTIVRHVWQYKKDGKWITTDSIPMTIVGGAGRGYRGYSFKKNLPGKKWRIRTTTDDNRTIGVTFLRLNSTKENPQTEFEEI